MVVLQFSFQAQQQDESPGSLVQRTAVQGGLQIERTPVRTSFFALSRMTGMGCSAEKIPGLGSSSGPVFLDSSLASPDPLGSLDHLLDYIVTAAVALM
jgi:hypothetical protein